MNWKNAIVYGLAGYGLIHVFKILAAEASRSVRSSGTIMGEGRGTSPKGYLSKFYTADRDLRIMTSVTRPKTLPRPGVRSYASADFRISPYLDGRRQYVSLV